MRLPPKPVRTLVITPVVFIGSLIVSLLSPLLHLMLAGADLIERRSWRFTRVGGLGIAFCVVETLGLIMALVLWIAGGLGLWIRSEWSQRLHERAFALWLLLITSAIKVFLGFKFEFPHHPLPPGPVVVLCRHAGPGDSLLVAYSLIHDDRRRVRMIGTTKLLWDPFFDHLVNRMPFHFCDPSPTDPTRELEAVAHAVETLEPDGAIIVFPEGSNWTPTRSHRAIERFEARGELEKAERARSLRHVLPPRTATTLAAIKAADSANIAFLAHAGLEDVLSLGDIWRSVPLRRTLRAAYWLAEPTTLPAGESLSGWLWDRWEEVDEWVEANLPSTRGDQTPMPPPEPSP